MADGEAAPSKEAPRIVLWHGNCQRFGAVGHPQRWVNVLGTVESGGEIASALFSLNGAEPKPFSLGPDGHRLARPGDFNIDLDRAGLLPGENTLWLRVETREGASDEARVAVEYANPGARWPLPYSIDWSRGAALGESVQIVDGKWVLTPQGVRTVEPYYDRVLAFGDESWIDYEIATTVIFHGFTPPRPGPPTFGVSHAAICVRWPGHDIDDFQPHRKWWPLGATAEFCLSDDLRQCKWRINRSRGRKAFSEPMEIRLGAAYRMKHRVITPADGVPRFSVKLWAEGQPEPEAWDAEDAARESDQAFRGGALLIAHNTDVTFGNVTAIPAIAGEIAPKGVS